MTKVGNSFSARFTASLLTSLGMTELITYNENEYEETALRLANRHDELVMLKSKLNKQINESPLYKSLAFTKDLEKIYKELVKSHI